MGQIEMLADRARGPAGKQRLAALNRLKELAIDDATCEEAVAALVGLWREKFATPSDLLPYVGTVIEIWKDLFDRVKPFQQKNVKVAWIMDKDYAALGRVAEGFLEVLGHFPEPAIGPILRAAFQQLTDPDLRMFALVSLLRRLDPVSVRDIEQIADSCLVRIYFWEHLRELAMESLMPAQWASPDALGASDLSRWLRHPNELNTFPEEVELMAAFPVEVDEGSTENVYLFRFRECAKPWEPGEGWMAGIAGPYRDGVPLQTPWSELRPWNSMSPGEHFNLLHNRRIGGCC